MAFILTTAIFRLHFQSLPRAATFIMILLIFVIVSCIQLVQCSKNDSAQPAESMLTITATKDDSDGRGCPSYHEFTDNIPLIKRADKCCLDKSSPPNRKNICYTNKLDTPWKHMVHLPQCPNEIDPELFVFTPEDPDGRKTNVPKQNITYANLNDSARLIKLTKSRELFIIIHGYQNRYWDKNWLFSMKDVLLELGHNAIVVKWTKGSNVVDYMKAAANTRSVAAAIANVIDVLIQLGKISMDKVTLVGFSLGAHVTGYVGSFLNGQIPRILALDPAGPLFTCQDPASRLDSTDAKFVQVIHTDMKSIFEGGFGTPERFGHVDFYLNGGLGQPGCPHTVWQKVLKIVSTFNMSHLSCSHKIAPQIAIELLKRGLKRSASENECQIQTFQCSNAIDWKYGRCFKACDRETCPAPGLDLLFLKSKVYQQPIYFNTMNLYDAGQLCGFWTSTQAFHVFQVAGGFTKLAYFPMGLILTLVIEVVHVSSSAKFLSKTWHNITTSRSKVITTIWKISKITKIEVLYRKYMHLILANGPMMITLTNVTVQEVSGELKQFRSAPVTVVDEVPMVIDLK